MSYPNFGIPDFTLSGIGKRIGHGLTSLIAGEGIPNEKSPHAVQDMYNSFRVGVRSEVSKIGFEGAFRTPSVHSTDNFEQHDLQTLRSKVDKIDLKAVADLKGAWVTIGSQEATSLTNFQQAMTKATDESVWRGAAREAAAQAVTDYTTRASQVAKAAQLTANKLDELGTGLSPTKELVPHVPEHRSGISNVRHWIAGRGWRDDNTAYDNAYVEAKRVLSTVYAPVVHESDTGVPVIPKPNEQNPAGPGDQPPPASWPPGGNTPGPSGPVGTSDTNVPEPGEQNPNERPANSQDPNSTASQSSPAATGQANDAQGGAGQARTDPSSATTPSGLDPNSFGPHSSGSAVPGGTGGGLGGVNGTNGPNGHGSSLPGAVQPGVPVGAGGRAAAAAGRAGTNGMPGMGGAGRGKGDKEEERTKSVPDYLVNQENGDELTGIPALPKIAPPVIGE
ncbi:hypothetical protein C5E45_00475 [Nocardia nova]|uniref:PPE family domain-containing protein n=1 Tax=Nocardia nova TaxID=37330 RepID=A0A2S6AWQ0_9NOCA|nr:hypothetical protein [Nocardia nova]PPJ28357.1 hypothetical protein C5E41_13695 [Nocardia nova]PPJ39676.1 hypothetical protein C5E45_00475 [Nocardia nova]